MAVLLTEFRNTKREDIFRGRVSLILDVLSLLS